MIQRGGCETDVATVATVKIFQGRVLSLAQGQAGANLGLGRLGSCLGR